MRTTSLLRLLAGCIFARSWLEDAVPAPSIESNKCQVRALALSLRNAIVSPVGTSSHRVHAAINTLVVEDNVLDVGQEGAALGCRSRTVHQLAGRRQNIFDQGCLHSEESRDSQSQSIHSKTKLNRLLALSSGIFFCVQLLEEPTHPRGGSD